VKEGKDKTISKENQKYISRESFTIRDEQHEISI